MQRAYLALALGAAARAQTVPATTTTVDTRACQPPFDLAHGFIFCDTARSLDERVNDLIERIWVTSPEVIPYLLTARNFGASNLSALGVPEYVSTANACRATFLRAITALVA